MRQRTFSNIYNVFFCSHITTAQCTSPKCSICTHSDRQQQQQHGGEAGRSTSTHGGRSGGCVQPRGTNCAQCTSAPPPRTFHSVAPGYHRYERTQRPESEYFACNCTQCRNLGTSMDICCQGREGSNQTCIIPSGR